MAVKLRSLIRYFCLIAEGVTGIETINSLPWSGSLFKVISPPNNFTSSRLIERPKTCASVFSTRGSISLLESFEYKRLFFLGNANARSPER